METARPEFRFPAVWRRTGTSGVVSLSGSFISSALQTELLRHIWPTVGAMAVCPPPLVREERNVGVGAHGLIIPYSFSPIVPIGTIFIKDLNDDKRLCISFRIVCKPNQIIYRNLEIICYADQLLQTRFSFPPLISSNRASV